MITLPRFYESNALKPEESLLLSPTVSHHVLKVLRHRVGDQLILFNNDGYDYSAKIIEIQKQRAVVLIEKKIISSRESPLMIHLGQVLSRGEKMDFTIQKSVELGVSEITPLFSQYCNVQLPKERLRKKEEHWQSVIISACEQCGRNHLPLLHPSDTLKSWLAKNNDAFKIIMHPNASQKLPLLSSPPAKIALLVGPEGGFSEEEIALARQFHFAETQLGPRILRTETAAMAAMSVLQYQYGDLK